MAFERASSIEVEIYRDIKGLHSSCCIIFNFKGVLSAFISHTHTPNNLHLSRTMKKRSNTELQFFTCMNCIPSIRFHRQRALSITGNRGVVYRDQTIAARKTTLNVAPMHFTSAQRIFRQYLCEVS